MSTGILLGRVNVKCESIGIYIKVSTARRITTKTLSTKNNLTFKSLVQVAKELLEKQNSLDDSELILSEESIQERVQLCLLDPGFPRLVSVVESILDRED